MSKEEKVIKIDLSKKIKFTDTIYISIGSLLLSTFIALLQFIIALNSNNWIITPACWTVLLNYFYAIRGGQSFGDKSTEKQASLLAANNTVAENRLLISKLTNKVDKLEKAIKDDNE